MPSAITSNPNARRVIAFAVEQGFTFLEPTQGLSALHKELRLNRKILMFTVQKNRGELEFSTFYPPNLVLGDLVFGGTLVFEQGVRYSG